jgi:hypothetical protein
MFHRTAAFAPLPVIVATMLLLTACGGGGGGDGGGGGGVVGLSQHGSTNSHNDSRRGTNCMDCHTSGPGTGTFITAGTSIPATGGYVEYYSDSARTDLHARLEVDAYGNFYTVTAIDLLTPNGSGFSPGAYVTIVTAGGSRRNMPGIISHSSAGCNDCHSTTGTQSPL